MCEKKYHVELSYQDEKMLLPKYYKFKINEKRFKDLLIQFKKYKSYKEIKG